MRKRVSAAVGITSAALAISSIAFAPTAAAAGKTKGAIARVDCKVHSISSDFGTTSYKACHKMIGGKKHVKFNIRAKDTRRDGYCAVASAYIGTKGNGKKVISTSACGKNKTSAWKKGSTWHKATSAPHVYALTAL
ncbi:hypothetical protein DY218_04115 [Streptomyces triticagri]|uniref:Secreted protein n=1 Tax=Streptomyces triticagri TaxID=2293568 RepID=A0A372MBG3_9ACTN|nr:hypothetical protein [Streptomyces triticagri]RFU87950.1 hypothetical protein DY218_04115 [Streptomyces triticagri]